MDNDRLVSNIADFLTTSDRTFELADFPHFFKSDVDVLIGRSSLFDAATDFKALISSFQMGAEIVGVEDFTRDTVYLGLYEDSSDVVQYLDVAGIEVGDVLRTPFTPDIPAVGTSIVVLNRSQQRNVLVVLGHSEAEVFKMIARLSRDFFRSGLVGELVGVYGPS